MPYIKANDGRREELRSGDIAQSAGELNYQIFWYTKHFYPMIDKDIIKIYVYRFLGDKPNYQKYNDMTGALIRCYSELKRRFNFDCEYLIDLCASYNDEIGKYEDIKIKENGDVE